MTYHLSALGSADPCEALKAAAKESSRVSLTMVRTHRLKGSPEKTRQIAQLLRDWSQGTGESFDAMMRRWQAKAAADAEAAKAPAAAAKESSRVALTMVEASRKRGSNEKTRQINQLSRDWGTPGESFDAMMRRWQSKAAADAATSRAAAAKAAQSSRVALTMVAAIRRAWSPEKDRQIAQLRRDWGEGTGESYDEMMRRWQAKAAADAEAAKACAEGGGAAPGAPGAPAAPGEGGGGPSAPDTSSSESGGKLLGLHWGVWAAGGAALLLGGAVLLRRKKSVDRRD
jgi:hypothetical protein